MRAREVDEDRERERVGWEITLFLVYYYFRVQLLLFKAQIGRTGCRKEMSEQKGIKRSEGRNRGKEAAGN